MESQRVQWYCFLWASLGPTIHVGNVAACMRVITDVSRPLARRTCFRTIPCWCHHVYLAWGILLETQKEQLHSARSVFVSDPSMRHKHTETDFVKPG